MPHTQSLSLSLSLSHTQTHTQSLSLSISLRLSPSLSTHTHTHTHTHTQTSERERLHQSTTVIGTDINCSQFQKVLVNLNCCIFQSVNGHFSHCFLFEIIFWGIFSSFSVFFRQKEKSMQTAGNKHFERVYKDQVVTPKCCQRPNCWSTPGENFNYDKFETLDSAITQSTMLLLTCQHSATNVTLINDEDCQLDNTDDDLIVTLTY